MSTRTMIFIYKSYDQGALQVDEVFVSLCKISYFSPVRQSLINQFKPATASRQNFISDLSYFHLFTLLVISMFHSDASITKDGTEMATITKQNFVATLSHNFLRLLHVVDLWTETLYSVERLGPIEEFNQLVWTLG